MFILFFILLCYHIDLFAHPTTFQGGVVVESKWSEPMQEVGLGYSIHSRFAIWTKAFSFQKLNQSWGSSASEVVGLQFNWLVKRWNEWNSQGNWYAGIGLFEYGFTSFFMQADWETRQIYTMIDIQ
ncbi:MAG: hypothetical protein NZ480_05605, partial [Bdellovibrionaceae bacterium]|nr:hypothetical protein [Pseudobdellovibrionaceae bacterium]MDW8190511.1 hypothetical protein [Pseudobdellovibrionaceae bacterium]